MLELVVSHKQWFYNIILFDIIIIIIDKYLIISFKLNENYYNMANRIEPWSLFYGMTITMFYYSKILFHCTLYQK